jgi:hypothetical protein
MLFIAMIVSCNDAVLGLSRICRSRAGRQVTLPCTPESSPSLSTRTLTVRARWFRTLPSMLSEPVTGRRENFRLKELYNFLIRSYLSRSTLPVSSLSKRSEVQKPTMETADSWRSTGSSEEGLTWATSQKALFGAPRLSAPA